MARVFNQRAACALEYIDLVSDRAVAGSLHPESAILVAGWSED
jgi:hypothetical protein